MQPVIRSFKMLVKVVPLTMVVACEMSEHELRIRLDTDTLESVIFWFEMILVRSKSGFRKTIISKDRRG